MIVKTLYTDGKFYVEKDYFVEGILVEGDKIIAIGSKKDLEKNADTIVSLEGNTVIPGINDSHLHLWHTGNALKQVDLTQAKSIEEVIEITKEFIKEHDLKDGQLVFGRGWNQDYFTDEQRLLERKDLDRISTDLPIILDRVCVHVTALNSKALELLNIPEGKVVEGGEIRLDENGEYSGIFTENAFAYAHTIVPQETKAEAKEKFLAAIQYAKENGITSVQACDYMGPGYELYFDILKEIYKEEGEKLRYYPQFNFQTLEGAKEYIETYYSQEELYDDTFQRGCWKLFKDGTLGARTALMRKPYHDDPSTKGVYAISDEDLEEMCAYAEDKGVRIVTHAIGDGAIQSMIDAYSKAMKEGNPLRHGIVHCQITDRKQLEDIAEKNITVLFQPIFLQYDIMMIENRVGKELAKTSYAFKTLYEMNHNLTSLSTDSPVEDLNPFPNIYCAVNRKRFNGFPEGGYYPEECLTVEEAIDNYTIGSAYSQGMEDRLGRLKEGYYADFIVLDRDIFTIDPMDIINIKPLATYIGGEKVWEK
ncbi:MAG: amidohydrolase [Tissierellia bacterium]|nr:amidohydrolase [Tissierellia bacterium]